VVNDDPEKNKEDDLDKIASITVTRQQEQIEELQKDLDEERDARREDRFVFVVVSVILLDVVFFSVMSNFGGPLALVILQLLILIPLAKRMGMEEIAQIMSRVIGRIASKAGDND